MDFSCKGVTQCAKVLSDSLSVLTHFMAIQFASRPCPPVFTEFVAEACFASAQLLASTPKNLLHKHSWFAAGVELADFGIAMVRAFIFLSTSRKLAR